VRETIPADALEPLGKYVTLTHYVDANTPRNKELRRPPPTAHVSRKGIDLRRPSAILVFRSATRVTCLEITRALWIAPSSHMRSCIRDTWRCRSTACTRQSHPRRSGSTTSTAARTQPILCPSIGATKRYGSYCARYCSGEEKPRISPIWNVSLLAFIVEIFLRSLICCMVIFPP
jgi:hypothetical protein